MLPHTWLSTNWLWVTHKVQCNRLGIPRDTPCYGRTVKFGKYHKMSAKSAVTRHFQMGVSFLRREGSKLDSDPSPQKVEGSATFLPFSSTSTSIERTTLGLRPILSSMEACTLLTLLLLRNQKFRVSQLQLAPIAKELAQKIDLYILVNCALEYHVLSQQSFSCSCKRQPFQLQASCCGSRTKNGLRWP